MRTANLVANLESRGIFLCEALNRLLFFSQWDSEDHARSGVRLWLAGNASVCGTGVSLRRGTMTRCTIWCACHLL
jgi:hypothetical protein